MLHFSVCSAYYDYLSCARLHVTFINRKNNYNHLNEHKQQLTYTLCLCLSLLF